jgi:APA family basic amino acid/polyamine antiporter
LTLVLGLSRVVLAWARRRDIPAALAAEHHGTPRRAVIAIGVAIAAIAAIGRIELAWTVSAATVLVYYAITNWAALRLPREQRRYPRAIAVLGLASCLALAAWAVVHLVSP